jgi:hypothetical protein
MDITGTGSLHTNENASATDTSDSPQVVEGPPRIYQHMLWLLGLVLAILATGLVLLFRTTVNDLRH